MKYRPSIVGRVVIITVLLALLFTPLYGISYLVGVYALSRQLTYSKIFDSIFSRTILAVLIFGAIIMITGTAAWLLHIQTYPPIVACLLLLTTLIIKKLSKNTAAHIPGFTKADFISLGISFVIIPIIALSFFFPKPSDAASFQIISNGYDNAAHLSLVRTTSDEKGYVYGEQSVVKNKTITDLNAYPQGWHLTISHLMNSFGINFFKSSNPFLAINAYLFSLAISYVITLFIATRIMWSIYKKYSKENDESLDTVLTFAAAGLLIQLLVYWGSLLLGFASFIGCLAYITLLISVVLDTSKSNFLVTLFISCLAAFATFQTWLLPLPAVLFLLLMNYGPRLKELLMSTKKVDRSLLLKTLPFMALAGAGALFQVLILLKFNPVDSVSALNDDGGIFWISNILMGVIAITTLIFWHQKTTDKDIKDKFIISIAPFVLLSGFLFVYQLLTMEKTSYYFVKSVGITVCVLGIFFVPAFVTLINRLVRDSSLSYIKTIFAVITISILMVATGQNTLALSGFKQGNSKVTTELAVAIEDYLKNNDVTKTHLMVLRDMNPVEESVATYFANRTAHMPDICESDLSLDFIAHAESPHIAEKIDRFKKCINEQETVVVITSDKTIDMIKALNNPRIIIKNVP